MPAMKLSSADVRVISAFARKVVKAPAMESIFKEAFLTLKTVSRLESLRIVYSYRSSAWR
jgi:hypothetical protein